MIAENHKFLACLCDFPKDKVPLLRSPDYLRALVKNGKNVGLRCLYYLEREQFP